MATTLAQTWRTLGRCRIEKKTAPTIGGNVLNRLVRLLCVLHKFAVAKQSQTFGRALQIRLRRRRSGRLLIRDRWVRVRILF